MNPRDLTRAQLVEFANNAATGVADGKVPGFLAAQNTAISEAITDAAAELATADMDQVTARAASMQATQIAQDKQETLLKLLQELKYGLKSVDTAADVYDALGYDPPVEFRQVITPNAPTELAAAGFSNGVNQLTFRGNNGPGTVTYVIEAKIGDTAPYVVVGTCTRQTFKHTGVTPGQFYQYRVRAQAARNLVSDWSNEAVVYGI
jgi:AraC-like DNA-binding protein